jgi:hypothetical protein
MLHEDLRYIMDNVNLTDDPVMKPLSLALCVRMKNALPQISFSKETLGDVETIELPFEFNVEALTDAGPDPIDHDPVAHVMNVISDECVEKFKSYKLFTVNFCGIYKTDIIGKFNVIFKIVK